MRWKRRWLGFCRRAGAKPGGAAGQGGPPEADAAGRAEEAFAELDRRYREPGRHYHTWRHVAACLRELRRIRPASGGPAEEALELAVWFHDAVNEPGREDNEERSASLAARWASALGLPPALGERAAGLVLATRHASTVPLPADPAAALLRDLDLAVLGSRRRSYRSYERRIAREHSRMPPERFREGRARLLRSFLARPEIYATPDFRRRLERRARRNLAWAIARLERARPGGATGRRGRPGARPGSR